MRSRLRDASATDPGRGPARGAHALDDAVRDAQVREHYAQLPAMVIAPSAGAIFTTWTLWDAVDRRHLVVGLVVLLLLSAARLVILGRYTRASPERRREPHWRRLAVGAAFVSGCVWGSAAPLLYPPADPRYAVFVIVLLTVLPIIPVAGLAAYMPAFYAYYLPCLAPFAATLALHDTRAERLAALLLVFVMAAMLVFARRYSRGLAQANRLHAQLACESSALEAAIEHRARLVAAASHDLRQPVHAMGLFLEMLREGGDAPSRDTVDHLDVARRGLRDMLDNLLDISRLDAGGVQPKPVDFALAGVMQRLCDEFAPQAAARGLGLRCRCGDAVVRSDPVLLERILRNLLSNALKYTSRGGVLLACRRAPHGHVWIQVVDTGIGVQPEHTRTIFDAFTRVHDMHEAHEVYDNTRGELDGLGLGLAIVRQTAELLGHPLRLRSRPGRGSVFGVEVMRSGTTQAHDVPGLHAPEAAFRRTSEAAFRRGPAATIPAQADASDRMPPMPAGMVLVVDDDRAVREGTARLLEQWGLRTIACSSIESALVALGTRTQAPDLALVDVRLSGGASGLAGVRSIRRATGRDTPVILVTADATPGRIREAARQGHFLLHKPVEPMVLRVCVADALSSALAGHGED